MNANLNHAARIQARAKLRHACNASQAKLATILSTLVDQEVGMWDAYGLHGQAALRSAIADARYFVRGVLSELAKTRRPISVQRESKRKAAIARVEVAQVVDSE